MNFTILADDRRRNLDRSYMPHRALLWLTINMYCGCWPAQFRMVQHGDRATLRTDELNELRYGVTVLVASAPTSSGVDELSELEFVKSFSVEKFVDPEDSDTASEVEAIEDGAVVLDAFDASVELAEVTAGVDVELTNGGGLEIIEPLGNTA
jgi:hypothetical protein